MNQGFAIGNITGITITESIANSVLFSAGTLSSLRSDVTFANSNGVTFGLETNGVITASVVPGGGGGSVNISAGTTSTNGTAFTFSNSNGVSFGLGTGANTGVITATVQTNYLTTAMASNRGSDFVQATAAFAGTNASGTINSTGISVSVAAPGAANINISAGTTSTNATAFTFSNANNVSFGLGTGANAGVVTGSIATTYAGTGFTSTTTAGTAIVGTLNTSGLSLGVPAFLTTAMASNAATISNINISAGTTSTNASAFTFSNLNNVTFGLGTGASAGVITASVPNVTNSAWTVSDSQTSGTVARLAFTNLDGVTLSLSTGANGSHTIVGSVKTDYAGTNSAITGGSLTVNTSGISINIAFPAQSNQTLSFAATSNTAGNTSGMTVDARSITLAGYGIASVGYSTSAGGSSVVVSATQSNQAFSAGGGSSAFQTLSFSNANGVSFTNTAGQVAGSISAIKAFGASNTGNTAGNTGVSTGVDWVIAGTNNITVSESTAVGGPNTLWLSAPNVAAGNVTFSAGTASQGLGSIIFSNSNNVSFGLGSGTASNIITATASVATSLTNINISAGTTSTNASAYTFSNSNNVTFGLGTGGSAGVITASVPNSSSLVGAGGISLSTNGSTITISESNLFFYEPFPLFQSGSTTWAPGIGTWHFAPFYLPAPISGGRLNIMVAHGSTASVLKATSTNYASNSTGTGSTNFTYERRAALYSLGGGTNSTRLESFWSNNFSLSIDYSQKVGFTAGSSLVVSEGATITMITSIDSAGAYTTSTLGRSTTVSSSSTALGSTAMTSNLTSLRNVLSSQMMIPIGFNTTINPGNYWLGIMWTTASTTATTGGAFVTNQVLSVVNEYGLYGNSNTAARVWGQTAATSGSQPYPGVGLYASTSAAPPVTVAFSDIRTFANQVIPYFNLVNSTI